MKRGVSRFSVESFWSHSAKKFCGHPFDVSESLAYRKILFIIGGITISVCYLLPHSTKKFRRGTLRCIRKFRASQIFMHKKRISLNSVEKSLSPSGDKIRQRTVLCFEKFLVSKSFKQRRGEASPFCRKFFYLTGPKKLRQGTILCCVSENFWFGNFFMDKRGGGIRIFRQSFCLTVLKNFIGENFGVSENFSYRKFSCIGGGAASQFYSKFFVSQDRNEKFCKRTILFNGKFLFSKQIYG